MLRIDGGFTTKAASSQIRPSNMNTIKFANIFAQTYSVFAEADSVFAQTDLVFVDLFWTLNTHREKVENTFSVTFLDIPRYS